jgi:serine-type D-Ala-D-Ala carboxypeptidase/endopeptidase (penicillin-binding protein 4)
MLKLLLAIIISAASAYPQTDYTYEKLKIGDLLKDTFFTSTGISISIYDLTEDKTVFELDTRKLLRPASNMKILTSAAGLLFLDSEYNFSTSLMYTGTIVNRTLYGDLYIKGGCDPDFITSDLDTLIKELTLNNIFDISGKIFIDLTMKDSLFWGKGWMWDDDPSTDAPYLSALNINDNVITVFVKPGDLMKPALITTEPETGYINIINRTATSNGYDPLTVTRDWFNRTNNIIAEGNISPSDTGYAVKLNVFSPESYFMKLFFEKLEYSGIKNAGVFFKSEVPEKAVNLYTFKRSLDTVIVNLNKVSDNLSAEMIIYALSEQYYGRNAAARNGLLLLDSLIILSGHNPENFVLADGSGVSHYNLVSTGLINDILNYIYRNNYDLFIKLYNSLPAAGIDGTLRTRMKGSSSENNVHAKTGTLSGVSSLSGYLKTKKGNTLSFSIILQNYRGSAVQARYFQDTICNILTGS